MKVYVDTDAEVRLMRRIKRGIDERQRDVNGGWAREGHSCSVDPGDDDQDDQDGYQRHCRCLMIASFRRHTLS